MVSRRDIVVFLNNKLITCDMIVPLLVDMASYLQGRTVTFYCFEKKTHELICNNLVLCDAIQAIGRLELLAPEYNGRLSIFHARARRMGKLFGLLLSALAGRVSFIHFNALGVWPLKTLFYINRRRTFFAEADSAGYSQLDDRVTNLFTRRNVIPRKQAAGALIAVSREWPELSRPESKRLPCYIVGPPHARPGWVEFVTRNADRYFEADFRRTGMEPANTIIAFMLSHIERQTSGVDFMAYDEALTVLLGETLDILHEVAPGVPVFLKPHYITDMKLLNKILAERPHGKYVVTNTHPSVLATRACFFVANYYTTTFAAIRQMNGVTVEYTHYHHKVLAATAGRSMRPEWVTHFINNDPDAFRLTVRNLVHRGPPAPPNCEAPPADDLARALTS